MSKEMKTLNGYEVVDEKARQDIETLKNKQVDVDLTGYATEDWVNNQGFIKEHQSLEGYATEKYVDDAIANIDIPEASPYVYTIQIENDTCVNSPDELRILYNKIMSGERVLCYWSCSEGVCHTRTSINTNTSIVMITPSHAYVQGSEVKFISGQLNIQSSGSVHIKTTNSKTAPTIEKVEEMISDALSGIATAEGGSY